MCSKTPLLNIRHGGINVSALLTLQPNNKDNKFLSVVEPIKDGRRRHINREVFHITTKDET